MSIPNFGMVTSQIYRGGQPNDRGLLDLYNMGFRAVLKLNDGEGDDAFDQWQDTRLIHWLLPTFTVDLQVVKDTVEIIGVIKDKLFIHCNHGRDRTGLIVGAYRLLVQNWTLEQVDAERAEFGVDNIIVEIADFAIHEALAELAKGK